jgi:phage shock protein PspC (stress-responsive transcriptional regulator)
MPDDHTPSTPKAPTSGPRSPIGGFTRSRTDRLIGGVAGGIAKRLDIEPIIVRAVFVILTVAGGGGLLLYALGWLLLPEEGQQDSIASQVLDSRPWESGRTRSLIIAGVVAFLLFGFLGALRPWHWALGRPLVAVIVVLAIAAYSRHHSPGPGSGPSRLAFHGRGAGPGGDAAPPVPGFGVGERPAGSSGVADRTAGHPVLGDPVLGDPTLIDLQPGDAEGLPDAGPYATTAFDTAGLSGPYSSDAYATIGRSVSWSPPPEPRQPSLVPPLLAGFAVLAGVSAVIAATGWVSVPLPAVLSVALLMSLAALVAGTRRGRFFGATVISLTLAGLLLLSTAVPHPLAGGVGQRTWHPAGAADLHSSYRLGTGQATLDLSDIPLGATVPLVRASVGTGDLAVIIPQGAAVQVRERAAIGGTDVTGDREGGVSVDRTSIVAGDAGPSGSRPPLHLDLQVGIGTVEVRRVGS